ncbi:uncharacterized protein MAM_08065 [Metarhizium album ARSEF 1941]|uniref:Uncharacterized protein n=1 Tax=Metarhizium album (strain ARSEF 1941) TaxID=1081103 RepID=A0A0B2WDV3_METAS|nr:uncharacterized protein MAM_08065 [Metarhizium album ARSEF 1941]KHN94056.1 hypothetical protein MAM_08065 [Metarhizium album ARSEF 1941]
MKTLTLVAAVFSAAVLAAPAANSPVARAAHDYACVCQYPNQFPYVLHCDQCLGTDPQPWCRTLRSRGTICA